METPASYDPSFNQQTTSSLYANHFRFTIDRLPDLTFFVQSVGTPGVSSGLLLQPNPFSTIHHPGKLSFGTFQVTFIVDAKFKNYFSIYYWMKGFGFPHSFDEVLAFRAKQASQVASIMAPAIDVEKTRAVLSVTAPDNGSLVAEIIIDEVFPMDLSGLNFSSTDVESPTLVATCTFSCSSIDIKPVL